MAGLLSGLYPTASGVVEPGDHLPDEAATIAEIASAAGMLTAAFLEGSAGGNDYGLAQGFDHFHLGPQPGEAALGWLQQHSDDDFVLVLRGWSAGFEFGPGVAVEDLQEPEGFYQRLQDALASELEGELRDLEPGDLAFVRELYAARIRTIDRGLGELMEDLRGLGLTDRATLVVLGTTGSDLEEHGAIGYRSLHSTVAHVPVFIRTPGGGIGRTVGEIIELVDVLPTLLDLVGLETPPTVQGTSLLPLVRGEGRPPYLAFSESAEHGGQRAIALGGYRLLISKEDDVANLFNLGVDPLELDNVADTEADKVDVMRRHLGDWEKMVAAVSLDPELRSDEPLDEETLERLKSLGYIH
jgi:arylsulfatase A-like enzyme